MPEPAARAASAVFATVSPEDGLGFYEDHRFRPKALVEFLSLSNADVSHITRISRNSVRYDEGIPKEMLERLEQIGNLCNLVAHHFAGDAAKTALWFRTKNPMLGDIAPRDMIRFGRYEKLRRFIVVALADQSPDDAAIRHEAGAEPATPAT
jgi:hypothetical protein